MGKILILIFIWHFIFFAEGSCDNSKNGVVLLIAPMIILKYFRKNVFKNKLTRVFFFFTSHILANFTLGKMAALLQEILSYLETKIYIPVAKLPKILYMLWSK